eukprot:159815-Rhodomonas_salina.1
MMKRIGESKVSRIVELFQKQTLTQQVCPHPNPSTDPNPGHTLTQRSAARPESTRGGARGCKARVDARACGVRQSEAGEQEQGAG